jgi:exopolysaccharide biosynthesis polyprenyl glycosylphosphotransferase
MDDARQSALRRVTLAVDAVLLVASLVLAYLAHGALRPLVAALKHPPEPADYAVLLFLVTPMWLVLETVLGLHRLFERRWGRFELLVELLKLHALGFLAVTGMLFLTNSVLNRLIVVTFVSVNLLLTFGVRLVITGYVRSTYARGETQRRWLLIGAPTPAMVEMVRTATAEPWPPRFTGLLCDEEQVPEGLPARLGAPTALDKVLHDRQVDLVLFFPPLHHPDAAGEALKVCERLGLAAAFAPPPSQRLPVAPQVTTLGDTPFITYEWTQAPPSALAFKHALDVIASVLGLVLLSPLLLGIALAIRLTMGGPVIFAQQRVGLHGRRFNLYKFRTMVEGAEEKRDQLKHLNEMSGPVFKIAADPRVTPLGAFLRKWSLDELPQLFNVVLGSMSLVGPRPLPVAEQQEIEGWFRRRLAMKPGITCLWQIGGRSDVDFEGWMKLDLRYIEQWSLWLDLKILLLTLPAVLSRRGAR